jgi:predicted DCC family thiol-disulfide oxidoreductase YuxK
MRSLLRLFLRIARRVARLLGARHVPPLREAFSYRIDPSVPHFEDDFPVLVIDGDCVLCSSFAEFVLRRDRGRRFGLLSARSPTGAALFRHFGLRTDPYETVLLIVNGCAYVRSEAAIRVFSGLGFPWYLARGGRILPLGTREAVYKALSGSSSLARLVGRRDAAVDAFRNHR